MKRRGLTRIGTGMMAVALSGSLLISQALPAWAADKYKDNKDKIETVYVNADAEGSTNKITVSEQLKNPGEGDIQDYSDLQNIKNVKGDEEFTKNPDGSLTWTNTGEDIYYQGESARDLPVDVKVTYFLDGKKISPDALAGKSGKVRIRFDYKNKTSQTVQVDQKNITVNTPFTIITAMILPVDHFSNVEVENGRAISDGDRNIVLGMAMPGLADSLKLSDYDKLSDIEIPDYVEVTADAKDFELAMTASIATTGTVNDFNLDKIDDLDDLKKDVDKLTDASSQLRDGSGKLLEGMDTLDSSLKKYTKGVSAVDQGALQLRDGLKKVSENKEAFEGGAETMTSGLKKLKNGTRTINKGIKDYTKGTSSLEKGIESAATGSSALKSGAKSLKKGLKDYTDGVDDVQKGIHKINKEVSDVKIPKDASDAAKQLLADAKLLKSKQDQLDKMMDKLSTLEDSLNTYKDQVTKWMGGLKKDTIPAINQAAKDQTESELKELAGKANKKAAGELNSASKSSHDKAVKAAKDAAGDASDDVSGIKEKLNALKGIEGLSEEDKNKIDSALDDLDSLKSSIDGIDDAAENAETVTVDADSYSLDLTTDAKGANVCGSLGEAMKSFPTIDLETDSVNTKEILEIVGRMKDQAKILEKYSSSVKDLKEKIPELKEGLETLDKGTTKLSDNSDDLVGGMNQLAKGIDSLNTGLDKLQAGAEKLTGHNKELTAGASSLDSGTGKLLSGSKKMELAVKQVSRASLLLANGAIELKKGTGKLDEAGGAINDGTGKLVGGMGSLNEGLIKFDEEGIQKIADLAGEDLTTVTNQVKAVKEADKKYQSYGGIRDGAKGSVKFIIETAPIEKEEE